MRPLSRLTIAVLLALTGALAACSDDGDGGTEVGLEDREVDDRDDAADDDADQDDDTDDEADDDAEEPEEPEEPEDDPDTGEEPTGDALAYIDAMTASFTDDETTPIPPEQGRCISTRIVEIAGVDRLVDAGISPEEFADEADLSDLGLGLDAGLAAVDSFGECGVDLRDLLIDSFAADADDPDAARACMEAAISAEQLREFFARSLVEGEEFEESPEAEAFFGGVFACAFGSLEG